MRIFILFLISTFIYVYNAEAQSGQSGHQTKSEIKQAKPLSKLQVRYAYPQLNVQQNNLKSMAIKLSEEENVGKPPPAVANLQWVMHGLNQAQISGVNNQGDFYGNYNDAGVQKGYVGKYSGGTFGASSFPTRSLVYDLNNFGWATFFRGPLPPNDESEQSINYHLRGAFKWLPDLGGSEEEKIHSTLTRSHINDHGKIAGVLMESQTQNRMGVYTVPGGNVSGTSSMRWLNVHGVNNRGAIVATNLTNNGLGQLILIRDRSPQNYGNLGTTISSGLNIAGFNNSDQVLFYASFDPNAFPEMTYFLFDYGEITEINNNDYIEDIYTDLNNTGMITGYRYTDQSYSSTRAILWADGEHYELNELAADFLEEGQFLTRATAVSDNGIIVVRGNGPNTNRALLRLAQPEIYWENYPYDDEFMNLFNWKQVETPTTFNAAVFDTKHDEKITVQFMDNAATGRLIVRNDEVELDLSGFTYTVPGNERGMGVMVGESDGEESKLTIKNGTLEAGSAVIGTHNGSEGEVTVDGITTEFRSNLLIVGFRGKGKLQAKDRARINTNTMLIGSSGLLLGGGLDGKGEVKAESGVRIDANMVVTGKNGKLEADRITIEPFLLDGIESQPLPGNQSALFADIMYITKGGKVEAEDTVRVMPGGILGGTGKISESVVNSGILIPGMEIDSLNREDQIYKSFTVDGAYRQTQEGFLEVRIQGSDLEMKNDTLKVEKLAEISGYLVFEVDSLETLRDGDRFLILKADSLSGEFDGFFGPEGFPEFYLTYDSTSVYLQIGQEVSTSAEDVATLPPLFELYQNYPNPFNPATAISYQLPTASDVRLEVFDMIGRRVAVLIDGPVQAGRHTVQFDASSLSSGVYIYRLTAGDRVFSRKLTLIK